MIACSTVFFILVPGRMVPVMAIVTSAAHPASRGAFLAVNSSIQNLCFGLAAYLGGALIVMEDGKMTGYGDVGLLAMGITLAATALAGAIRMHARPDT